jgi:hypothetical protein
MEWFAHEWLAAIAFAGAWSWVQWPGVVWLSALLIAVAHLLLYRHLVRRATTLSFRSARSWPRLGRQRALARPAAPVHGPPAVVAVTGIEEVIDGRRGRARSWRCRLWRRSGPTCTADSLVLFPVLACYGVGMMVTRAPTRAPGARSSLPALAAAASAAAVLINPWGFHLVRRLVGFFAARVRAPRQTNEFSSTERLDDRAGVSLAIFLLCPHQSRPRLQRAPTRPGRSSPS